MEQGNHSYQRFILGSGYGCASGENDSDKINPFKDVDNAEFSQSLGVNRKRQPHDSSDHPTVDKSTDRRVPNYIEGYEQEE